MVQDVQVISIWYVLIYKQSKKREEIYKFIFCFENRQFYIFKKKQNLYSLTNYRTLEYLAEHNIKC